MESNLSQEESDVHWMQWALALARKAAELGEVPVGAVLVRRGEIIGEGHNLTVGGHDPTGHAEIRALRAAATNAGNYRLPQSTLYVTIEPCAMCFGALVHARIARLVYAAAEPKAGVVESHLNLPSSSHFNHRIDVSSGVMANQAGQLMKDFFAARR